MYNREYYNGLDKSKTDTALCAFAALQVKMQIL